MQTGSHNGSGWFGYYKTLTHALLEGRVPNLTIQFPMDLNLQIYDLKNNASAFETFLFPLGGL